MYLLWRSNPGSHGVGYAVCGLLSLPKFVLLLQQAVVRCEDGHVHSVVGQQWQPQLADLSSGLCIMYVSNVAIATCSLAKLSQVTAELCHITSC